MACFLVYWSVQMLDIFLNNKFPGTNPGWTDELIQVASIHNEFNGLPFVRGEIASRFSSFSNRLPEVRDSSDYRDEYGAYVSYLGIMFHKKVNNSWIYQMNPNSVSLLCSEYPDPNAYMRLQMSIFQYPNPIGAQFQPNGNLTVEHGSLKKRISQINNKVQIAPFRTILRALVSLGEKFGIKNAFLTYSEIWFLIFQNLDVVTNANFDGNELANIVMNSRITSELENLKFPQDKLRNLHLLLHTNLIQKDDSKNILYLTPEILDKNSPSHAIARSICELSSFFSIPYNKNDQYIKDWTKDVLENGEWMEYFPGFSIPFEISKNILQETALLEEDLLTNSISNPGAPLQDFEESKKARKKRLNQRQANPEETQALREKANLQHRLIVKLIADKLRARDYVPESNIFIDLCCEKPEKILFEIKSCNLSNQLSQVRKGISQLYEYRYRHDKLHNAKLVLALENAPFADMSWITDYLVQDRSISMCWLEGENNIVCPELCKDDLSMIIDTYV